MHFDIHHCSSKEICKDLFYSPKGYFHVALKDKTSEVGNLKLAGRVVGTVVAELIFKKISNNSWEAHYNLPSNGSFYANIEIRYLDFNSENYLHSTVYSISNEILTDNKFHIAFLNESDTVSIKNDCDDDDFFRGGYWRALSTHKLPAKWLLDVGCEKLTDFQTKVTEDFIDKLIFEPLNCRIKNLTNLLDCELSKRSENLCFVGDSQMRQLSGTIQSIFAHDAAAFAAPISHKTDKTVIKSGYRHFIVDTFAEMNFNVDELGQLQKCDSIFIGFGQWHLSFLRKVDIFSSIDYAALVNQTLWAYAAISPKANLYFMGTFPFAQNFRLYSNPPIDFRNDVVLRKMNAAGMKVCNRMKQTVRVTRRVSCMNLFEMVNVVRDLSYDMAHFKAPVGLQMALAVMTRFCSD